MSASGVRGRTAPSAGDRQRSPRGVQLIANRCRLTTRRRQLVHGGDHPRRSAGAVLESGGSCSRLTHRLAHPRCRREHVVGPETPKHVGRLELCEGTVFDAREQQVTTGSLELLQVAAQRLEEGAAEIVVTPQDEHDGAAGSGGVDVGKLLLEQRGGGVEEAAVDRQYDGSPAAIVGGGSDSVGYAPGPGTVRRTTRTRLDCPTTYRMTDTPTPTSTAYCNGMINVRTKVVARTVAWVGPVCHTICTWSTLKVR